tara:strand:+ start:188 stop:478 length:291 start_codon:yes stop_codon:yes gene_type:complete
MEPGKKRSIKEKAKKFLQSQGNKMPLKNKLVGGSGAFGLVGGVGGVVGKMANKFLGAKVSKLAKGGKKENIGGFREFANQKLRKGLNKGDKKDLTY